MPSLNYLLQLSLGSDKIDFISDAGGVYFLLDSTFSAPPPKSDEVRSRPTSFGGTRVMSKKYNNREVSFSIMIKGASTTAVIASYNFLRNLVERGSSDKTALGGIYNQGATYETGGEVGEDGLILRAKLQHTGGEDRITFRVVSGSVKIPGYYGVGGIGALMGGKNSIERVDITLECEPYAMGSPRQIAAPGGIVYGRPNTTAAYDPLKKRFLTILGSSIAGDGPAPIKFVAGENVSSPQWYDGMTIARESGQGVLHCPSAAISYGAGTGYLWVKGGADRGTIKQYKVEIDGVGTPNTFRWSINNGVSWVASAVPITSSAIKLGSNDVYVQFTQTVGHTLGRGWNFKNDQSYMGIDAEYSSINLANRSGIPIATFFVNIPYGHAGRYKVALQVTDGSSTTEWSLAVGYTIPFTDGFTGAKQVWTGSGAFIVYPGILDLTRESNPIARYPGAHTMASVTIYARRRNTADTSALNVISASLIPVESKNSFIMYTLGAGLIQTDWNAIFCGYDPRSPVIGVKRDVSLGLQMFMPLHGEYIGDIPVLEPGVDQSLYVIPTYGTGATSAGHTSSYVDVEVIEYRPRYLSVG